MINDLIIAETAIGFHFDNFTVIYTRLLEGTSQILAANQLQYVRINR